MTTAEEAFELLSRADEQDGLAAPELMQLADAAYGAGELEIAFETLERAHASFLAADDQIGAAQAATRLAMLLLIDTGLLAPVRGWIKRAERLLEAHGETPVHAWLTLARACERMLSGDFEAARVWAARAIELGDRYGELGAELFGRNVDARCHIFEGRIDKGLALLEDVAASLLVADIDPLTAGCIYCEIVCAFQGLARYDKAEEWTVAMERFSHDRAIGSISGRCRVHRAEILRLRGDLGGAERTALDACEELRPYLRHEFGWPLAELGRIRYTRGDLAGAEEAFLAAHELGWEPHPGLALLQLAQGDAPGALTSIQHALAHPLNVPSKEWAPNSELRRAPLLEALVEIAVVAGDIEAARGACDELTQIAQLFGSKAIIACSALASGRVRLAEGDTAAARFHLQNAVQHWSEIAAPFECAVARTILAQAHRAEENEQSAVLELRAAQSTFARVGAQYHADLVADALGETTEPPPVPSTTNEFRCEGDVWSLGFGGKAVRIRDVKGLHHLARLMSDPGREFHAVDLVALDRGAEPTRGERDPELVAQADSDAGELLDERAKELYRRRLTDIEEDIEEARTFGDAERVARCEAEKGFIVGELSRAVGLGGRDRRAGATSERARASVTRAIRNAMTRIAELHPDLAEHLERTVRTGTFCVYLPDPRVPADWAF